MDKDEGAEEEDLDVVIEVLIADEVEEDMADDDATDDVTDDVILAKGADKKLARKDRERHVRTKKFFSELRSLNLSSRRRHVHAEAETLSVGAVPLYHCYCSYHTLFLPLEAGCICRPLRFLDAP